LWSTTSFFSPPTPINFFNEDDLPAKHEHNSSDYATLFQQGEEKGFAWFFRELYPALCLYAFKITGHREASEEIASNAFIVIWKRHEKFSDALSIRKYLYLIVRNDALKYLRDRKTEKSKTFKREVAYLYGSEYEKDCFNSLVTAETLRLLLHAIHCLPEECSKVFRLLYIEGKSVKETAEALQVSPSTVKTQKKRGIETLRKTFHLSIMLIIVAIDLLRF